MNKTIIRCLALVLVIVVDLTCFSNAELTRSFLSNAQVSNANTFAAGTFDFSFDSGNSSPAALVAKFDAKGATDVPAPPENFYPDVSTTQAAALPVTIVSMGSLDFGTEISTANWQGDLCDLLNLTATNQYLSSGEQDIKIFSYNAGSFKNNGGVWTISATLKNGAKDWEGKSCGFDTQFYGKPIGGSGFTVLKVVPGVVYAAAPDFATINSIDNSSSAVSVKELLAPQAIINPTSSVEFIPSIDSQSNDAVDQTIPLPAAEAKSSTEDQSAPEIVLPVDDSGLPLPVTAGQGVSEILPQD